MLPLPQFPRKKPELISETIEDETVIVNLDNGTYYSLVGAGSVLWNELEAGQSVEEILARMGDAYDASPQEIKAAIQELLQELVQEELVTIATHAVELAPAESEPAGSLERMATKRKFQVPHLLRFTDMQELLLLDPIHEVDETGWPHSNNEGRA